MMQCNYYLLNPTKNITILVESQFPSEVQPFVAKKLLKIEKTAEQVGFIINEKSKAFDIKIRMAGGEFCGNACMAAASLVEAENADLKNIKVSISGCDEPVLVQPSFEKTEKHYTVEMPKTNAIDKIEISIDGNRNIICPMVHLNGISHIIINEKANRNYAENIVKELALRLNCDAIGLMFVNEKFNELTPLVYVKQADTLYWENSCASGTTALGYYLLSERFDSFPLSVHQPGGFLEILPDFNKNTIKLKGSCEIQKYVETVI